MSHSTEMNHNCSLKPSQAQSCVATTHEQIGGITSLHYCSSFTNICYIVTMNNVHLSWAHRHTCCSILGSAPGRLHICALACPWTPDCQEPETAMRRERKVHALHTPPVPNPSQGLLWGRGGFSGTGYSGLLKPHSSACSKTTGRKTLILEWYRPRQMKCLKSQKWTVKMLKATKTSSANKTANPFKFTKQNHKFAIIPWHHTALWLLLDRVQSRALAHQLNAQTWCLF